MRFRCDAWIRFLRLPNLLTVPGDVLVGAALAGTFPGRPCVDIPAVCLAYLFGMALNDCVDLKSDRVERPERPLPAGEIPVPAAWLVCVLLGAGALVWRPAASTGGLLAAVVAYTLLKNLAAFVGPPLMALCRALAVWIGAGGADTAPDAVWIGAGLWLGYIFAVTVLARLETRDRTRTRIPDALPWAVLAGLIGLGVHLPPAPFALLPVGFLLWRLNRLAADIRASGRVAPRHIGGYLGLLFVLQASALAMAGQPAAAAVLWLGWPLQRALAARVPPS